MSFRDDLAAQEQRNAALKAQADELKEEIAQSEATLESLKRKRLPLLDRVEVASPCPAKWEEMIGDDQARFCEKCEKNVYNLSSMYREEAEALIREKEGKMCVRFFRRSDGTLLTADCPTGVRIKRFRRIAAASLSGLALLGIWSARATQTMGASSLPRSVQVATSAPVAEPPTRVMAGEMILLPRLGKPAKIKDAKDRRGNRSR